MVYGADITGGSRIRVAVRVDVIPPQRPGLLGPDPGGQGQDHVGAETVASDLWAATRG